MNATLPTGEGERPRESQTRFIIRLPGGFALKFHTNLCGKVYSAVADDEASRFVSVDDADWLARDHGLRRGQFTVEPFSQTEEAA